MDLSSAKPRLASARAVILIAVAAIGGGLAGCNDEMGAMGSQVATTQRIAARPGISPRGAPLALASVEGAPDAITSRFLSQTAAAAASRDIANVDVASATYLARGYLTAYPVQGGTAIGYVWDMFDKSRHRVQRLEDAVVVQGTAADPWSLVDDRTLASLAARGADDLAAVLTNTPEAIAAAGAPGAVAAAVGAGVSPPAAPPADASAYR